MPAIASLEDLKSARKEGVSIYAMFTRRSLGAGGRYLSSEAEQTA